MPQTPKDCPAPESCPYVADLATLTTEVQSLKAGQETLMVLMRQLNERVAEHHAAARNDRAWLGGLMWLVGILIATLAFLHDHIGLTWSK